MNILSIIATLTGIKPNRAGVIQNPGKLDLVLFKSNKYGELYVSSERNYVVKCKETQVYHSFRINA